MKGKISVLITPSGTQTAIEIIKSLRNFEEIELYGCDTDPFNVGQFMVKEFVMSPPLADRQFFLFLSDMVEEKKIDLIYPAHEWFILPFAERKRIGKARCIVPPVETARVIVSKESTYNYLKETIRVPKVYDPLEVPLSDYPIFVKPNKGKGSEEAYKVRNEKGKSHFLESINDPLFLEYLPGKEYTVDCMGDMNGKLLVAVIRERIKILRGISAIARVVENKKIVNMAEEIANKLILPGAWFFQVKENKQGEPVLLEVNARIGGTCCLSRIAGVNLPYLTMLLFMNQKIDYVPSPAIGLSVTRYLAEEYFFLPDRKFKCVVWDMDDTLWYGRAMEDKLLPRPGIESILIELKRKGIIQCLISRNPHLTNAKEKEFIRILRQNGIPEVFSYIKVNDILKSESIKKIASKFNLNLDEIIYIDDAFSEREEVRKNASGVFILDAVSYRDALNLIR